MGIESELKFLFYHLVNDFLCYTVYQKKNIILSLKLILKRHNSPDMQKHLKKRLSSENNIM